MSVNPDRPIMSNAEAQDFGRDYQMLMEHITKKLKKARWTWQAKEPLRMLKHLAGYDFPQSKTMYGLALLMEDKPWYNGQEGLAALKDGAECERIPQNKVTSRFCLYEYGRVLLNGAKGITPDPIMGKYWIDKAADEGYEPAIELRKERWGL